MSRLKFPDKGTATTKTGGWTQTNCSNEMTMLWIFFDLKRVGNLTIDRLAQKVMKIIGFYHRGQPHEYVQTEV